MERTSAHLQIYNVEELREFEARPENRQRHFELLEGIIYEKMIASILSSSLAMKIGAFILAYLDSRDDIDGTVTAPDGGFILSDTNKYMPDVGFISSQRLPEVPNAEVKMAPDLAVEVQSPSDSQKELQQQTLKYLQYGTPLVWIVYPEEQTVEVYRARESQRPQIDLLKLNDTLDGGVVLPGFELPVASIFS